MATLFDLCNRLVPSAYRRSGYASVECIGVLSLVLAMLLFPWARDWARPFEVLLVLATVVSAPRIVREDPDAWIYLVMLAFVAWTIAINQLSYQWYPNWTGGKLEDTRDCARLFYFAMCGWWMGATRRGIMVVASCAVIGIVLAYVVQYPGNPVSGWLDPRGGEFGFRNSQHAAVVTGPVLLALLLMGYRWITNGPSRRLWYRVLAWLLAVAICLVALEMTGNRQVWLGILAGIGAVALLAMPALRRRGLAAIIQERRAVATLIAIVVLAMSMAMAAKPAWNKMQHEWAAVQQFFDGNEDETTISSATIRLYLWAHSLEVIAERPLTGYGGKSATPLIKSSDLPEKVRHFGHVHNSYLGLWTLYGAVAPLALVTIFVGLAIRAANACRNSCLPRDVATLFLVWMAFLAVVHVFESYVHYDSGVFLMMTMGGILYSATLPSRTGARAAHRSRTSTQVTG